GLPFLAVALGTSAGPPPSSYTEEIPGTTVRFEMIAIPGGSFRMGSPDGETGRDGDEGPVRDVSVSPYFIGKTEVTWDEFEAFYLGQEKTPDGVDAVTRPSPFYLSHDRGWGRGKRPACGISFHAAETYCEWLSKKTGRGYRLPTEAEWEYAARAGSSAASPQPLGDFAWYKENSGGRTQEAAQKKPNAFGLFDMLGNVW